MPRGGQRVGAGRPRKPKPAIVLGMDGARRPEVSADDQLDVADVSIVGGLAEPPVDLSLKRQEYWRLWAPRAIQEGTLLASRVLGFRQLVAQLEMVEDLDKKITELGTATRDAAEAMKSYVKLAQRLDSTLARFKLTSNGKSEVPAKKGTSVNAWAAVAKK